MIISGDGIGSCSENWEGPGKVGGSKTNRSVNEAGAKWDSELKGSRSEVIQALFGSDTDKISPSEIQCMVDGLGLKAEGG